MQAPHRMPCGWEKGEERPLWRRARLAGIGVVVLVASAAVNVVLFVENWHQYDLLVKQSPGLYWTAGDAGLRSAQSTGNLLDMGSQEGVRSFDALAGSTRRLSGSSSLQSSSSHSSASSQNSEECGSVGGQGDAHVHKTDALLYLFNAFIIGAAVMQLSARFPILQQTVVLFVLGFIGSLFLKGLNLKQKMGIWGRSYDMWIGIDPHLLLFTLLPALLAGDAMSIDTSVAKRVAFQCLYLAGPGVLFCGFGTAGFLSLYLGWDFKLSLCAGAILCATDPVAVVALLKELGASPMLTVQIQGESLLNDGTAIVLYLISYNMISGEDYDAADIAEFLVKKAMMAWALGLFIGYFFFTWIHLAADKLDHSSSMIQITLTLCCAYWSFIFVEGVLTLSGVLATVASSLVLAHHMWPYVVCPESMLHVWHTFESLGNTIIFFLAGSITGAIVVDIDPVDIINLLVIYVFLLFIRGFFLFASRPILKLLSTDGKGVTWQDCTLMTWGGLRGAVGLALAIQVNNDRAAHIVTGEPQITKKDGERLLFFVSGIVFLTMIVNATTAPALVLKLGITAQPQARMTLLKMFNSQLLLWAQDSRYPETVTDVLREMLSEEFDEMGHAQTSNDGPKSSRSQDHIERLHFKRGATLAILSFQPNYEIIDELRQHEEWYKAMSPEKLRLMGQELLENTFCEVDDIIEVIKDQLVDEGMAKVVNHCFMTMVYNKYWLLIEEGSLRPGSPEADVLLTSVRVSLSPYKCDLRDFDYVSEALVTHEDFVAPRGPSGSVSSSSSVFASEALVRTASSGSLVKPNGWPSVVVSSSLFNVVVALVILLNSIQVVCEEIFRDPKKDDWEYIWLALDLFFTGFFFVEFLLKLGCMKFSYFVSWWNRFDFFLVVVGIFGCITSVLTHGSEATLAGQTRIIRIARVLRTLRFLRIFRLFHAKMSADSYVSEDLARHLKKIVTLDCFIRAHLRAQKDLVMYFGGNGKIDTAREAEIGRCILQSQVATYRALKLAATAQDEVGTQVCEELRDLTRRKSITAMLSEFVLGAHRDGALSATETHAILHPLYHQIAICMKEISDRTEGVIMCPKDSHRSSVGSKGSQRKASKGSESSWKSMASKGFLDEHSRSRLPEGASEAHGLYTPERDCPQIDLLSFTSVEIKTPESEESSSQPRKTVISTTSDPA